MIHYVRRSANQHFGSTIKMNIPLNPKPHTNSEMDSKIIIKHLSKYEQFQEWMNKCPVDILDYVDNVDTVNVRFELPLEVEEDD